MSADRAVDTVQMWIPKFGKLCTVNTTEIEYWRAQGATLEGEAPAPAVPSAPAEPTEPASTEPASTESAGKDPETQSASRSGGRAR